MVDVLGGVRALARVVAAGALVGGLTVWTPAAEAGRSGVAVSSSCGKGSVVYRGGSSVKSKSVRYGHGYGHTHRRGHRGYARSYGHSGSRYGYSHGHRYGRGYGHGHRTSGVSVGVRLGSGYGSGYGYGSSCSRYGYRRAYRSGYGYRSGYWSRGGVRSYGVPTRRFVTVDPGPVRESRLVTSASGGSGGSDGYRAFQREQQVRAAVTRRAGVDRGASELRPESVIVVNRGPRPVSAAPLARMKGDPVYAGVSVKPDPVARGAAEAAAMGPSVDVRGAVADGA